MRQMRGLLLQIRWVSDGLDYSRRAGDDKETEEMLAGYDRLGVGWERMGESRMTLSFDGTIYGDEEHWGKEEEERGEFGPVGCEMPDRHPSAEMWGAGQ